MANERQKNFLRITNFVHSRDISSASIMSQTNSIVFEGIEVNGSIRGNGKHYAEDSDAEEVDEEAGQDPSTSTLGRITDRFGFFRPDLDEQA